jgi:hypothetical protein
VRWGLEPTVWLPAAASVKEPGRASPLETIVWPLGTTSLKVQVGAAETLSAGIVAEEMLDPQAHASAEAAPGQPAEAPARPFQAAQAVAQVRLVFPVASARSAEPAARDALEEAAQPQAAGHAGAALPAAQHAAAGVVAVEQHAAVAEVAPQASAAAEGARRGAAAVPGAQAALLSEVPWAFRRDQAPHGPAP